MGHFLYKKSGFSIIEGVGVLVETTYPCSYLLGIFGFIHGCWQAVLGDFLFSLFFMDLFCIVEVPSRNLLKSSGRQMNASGSHAEPLRSSIRTPPDTPKLMAVVWKRPSNYCLIHFIKRQILYGVFFLYGIYIFKLDFFDIYSWETE